MCNSLKASRPLVACIVAICLSGAACGEQTDVVGDDEQRTDDELMFDNSVNPSPSYQDDFNVYETRELENIAFDEGPLQNGSIANGKMNDLQRAASYARTAVSHLTHKPYTPEGETSCETAAFLGTGQMVGYNTALTAHHVALYDDPQDITELGTHSIEREASGQSPLYPVADEQPDSVRLRKRLYSLGFTSLANPNAVADDSDTFDEYFRNWTFYIVHNGYATSFKDDVVLEAAQPKCFAETPYNVPVYGPGMFTDWMRIKTTNSIDHQGHDVWANGFQRVVDNLVDTEFLHTLAILPGVVDEDVPRVDGNQGCTSGAQTLEEQAFTITDYADVQMTSLDATNGISGSGVWHLDDLFYTLPHVWGIASDVRHPGEPEDDTWDRAFSSDCNSTIPTTSCRTGVALIGNSTDATNDDYNDGRERGNGSPEPSRGDQQGFDEPEDYEMPKPPVIDDPQSDQCVGECSGEQEFEKVCSDVYEQVYSAWSELNGHEDYRYLGSGIGIWGGPGINRESEEKFLTDFGLVCGPWSSYPYSMFWSYVVRTGVDVAQDMFDVPSHKQSTWASSRVLSLDQPASVNRNFATEHGRLEQMPFQNCPPGYVLTGILFSQSEGFEYLLGARKIRCKRIYDNNDANEVLEIPLIPDFYENLPSQDEYLRFYNEIGDVESTNNLEWLTCQNEALEHISGLRIYYDSPSGLFNTPVHGVFPYCTYHPPALEPETEVCSSQMEGGEYDHSVISSPYGAPEWPKAPSPSCAIPGGANCP